MIKKNRYIYNIFSLILLVWLTFFFIFYNTSHATEVSKFAVYYFSNLTGNNDWDWLEKGLPDMLCQTFSQSEIINYIPLEKIEKLTTNEYWQGIAEKKDLNLFRNLNNFLEVDLIFTGYFSEEQGGLLSCNLVAYHSHYDELLEYREIKIFPEDLFSLKENIARIILKEVNVSIDDELAHNLKKNISNSVSAIENYYKSKELKEQAIKEYQGIDFPSKPLWSKAIDFGEKAVLEDPYFADAYYLLSQIYQRTKWTIREITALEKFIETAQNNNNIKVSYDRLSEALYRLAYSKYVQGNINATLDNLEDSIYYQPNNIKSRILLMQVYYESGQISKALKQAEEIKKIDSDNREIEWFFKKYQQAEIYGKEAYELYVAGYNAYSNKKWFDAIRLLTQSVNINKEFKEANYFLGLSYYHLGDLDNSIHYLEETIRLDPFDNNARIYLNKAMEEKEFGREAVWIFNQGYQLYISGEYEGALLKFKESLEKNPDYQKSRIYLMRTYYHLNKMDEYLTERERIGDEKLLDLNREREYYQLAYNFYSLGDYQSALEKLMEIIKGNPNFLEARFLMAETLYQLGNYKDANQHYRYIIDNFKDTEYYENSLLSNGWCSFLIEDYNQAEEALEILITKFPQSSLNKDATYKLGKVYFQQKKYDQTINLYESLLEDKSLELNRYEIKYILGQSYFWEEIYDKAKAIFLDIIMNCPDFKLINETKYYYSFTLFREGNLQEARTILEGIVKNQGQFKEEINYLLARVFLEEKEYNRAIEINMNLIDQIKDDSLLEKVLFDLGLAYSRQGKDQQAVSYFERVIDQFPESELLPIVFLELAQSYFNLEKYQKVLDILEKLDSKEAFELKIDAARKINDEERLLSLYQEYAERFSLDSKVKDGYFILAKSKYEKGEFAEAIEIFEKIKQDMIISKEISKEINYWLGLSFYRLADYRQAEKYFQDIDYLVGDEIAIRALYMLGETSYKQGEYSEAIKYYQEFLKYYKLHSLALHVQYSIGWCYLNLKDYFMAIDSFNKLVYDYPESEFSEEAHFLIGKIYFLVKNNQESKLKLLDFIKAYPESEFSEEAIYIVAQIYLEEEKWIDSIIYFEKLISNFPESKYLPGSLYGLCLSYYKKEEYEKSLLVGDRYLHNFPSGTFFCDVLYITAICQEGLGYQLQADEKYEQIIQECSQTPYVDVARKKLEKANSK